MDNLQIKILQNKAEASLVIGSVEDVIASRIDPKLENRKFQAQDYLVGFEIGSPRNFSSLGESLVTHGLCFTHCTDSSSSDYRSLIKGPSFVTSGMFLLPKTSNATHKAHLSIGRHPPGLYDVYQALYQDVKRPFVFAGVLECLVLHTQAIAKPPLGGLNIFEHKDKFYPYPSQKRSHVSIYVVGAVADPKDPLSKALNVVLYHNPSDSQNCLDYHAHGLVLDKTISSLDHFTIDLVKDCVHVFSEGTIILRADLDIYALSSIREIT